MARLRVGDIEIDGTNVSIGGVPQAPVSSHGGVSVSITTTGGGQRTTALVAPTPSTTTALAPPASTGLDGLAALPFGDRVLFGGGTVLIAVAIALLAATQASLGIWLLFPGIGAVIVGALRRVALTRQAATRERALERELRGHADRLRSLLADGKPAQATEQTVEWIVQRSGLPEATVVRTLAFMRARDQVTEDLNVDTGDWYYAATRALPAGARDLDDRLAALEEDGKR